MFSSPKSQHEVPVIGTGRWNRRLTMMWGTVMSPRVGAPMMIHNSVTTLPLLHTALWFIFISLHAETTNREVNWLT
jgi:hypothetical protein